MNKVYVEYDQSHILRKLMKPDNIKLNSIINNYLNQFFRMTNHNHKYHIEIIMPEDNNTFCCDSSPVLTCHTIACWKSVVGKYSFIEDREEVKLDISKKGIGYNRKQFYDKVHNLNRQFNMSDINHNKAPEAFESYRSIYKDEFGVDLPDLYEGYVRIACRYDLFPKEEIVA